MWLGKLPYSVMILITMFLLVENVKSGDGLLTPDSIIELCASGKKEDQIISEIKQKGINFDVNVPVLQKLVDGGVSPSIIEVVLSCSSSAKSESPKLFFSSQEAKPGLTLVTRPPGMTVFIDNTESGVTPFMSNKIKPGRHLIRVEHPLFFAKESGFEMAVDPVYLEWDMEAREPIVRLSFNVFSDEDQLPWSWVVRPRENCPDDVSLGLSPWTKDLVQNTQSIFILSESSKRTFSGHGSACLEVYLWHGRMRSDLPLHQLPPCTTRFYVSNISIDGLCTIDLNLKIQVPTYDPSQPVITLDGENGRLVFTQDKVEPANPETIQENFLNKTDMLAQ
jgi:hypothetical protein